MNKLLKLLNTVSKYNLSKEDRNLVEEYIQDIKCEQIESQSLVEIAREMATKAHKDQKRWGGEPYIKHPESVVERLREDGFGDEFLCVGWLHDVVEDTDVTIEEIREKFGDEITDAVFAMTKKENVPYSLYIKTLARNNIAAVVKMADLMDNLSDLKDGQRRDKYELAYLYLHEATL